jgi:hypothetical protein
MPPGKSRDSPQGSYADNTLPECRAIACNRSRGLLAFRDFPACRNRAKPRVGGAKRPAAHAQGIAAEILFCGKAVKKIGAESPVPACGGNAPKFFFLHFTFLFCLTVFS